MNHWRRYIEKQKQVFLSVPFPSERRFDMVVVIPCYDEPDIEATLLSLRNCKSVQASVLVLIVINSGVHSPREAVLQNMRTHEQLQEFAGRYSTPSLFFHPVFFSNLPRKHAGVGLARKIGMDLAVANFLRHEVGNGVLVSLDADCVVSENYLTDIYAEFVRNEKLCCTIHAFQHRAENDNPEIESAVRQYERYICYFRNMLRYIGFPYYFHTIGSAFAVSADAYVRVGGMGRQQGGEDFYFLQKIFALGKAHEMENVCVYPMARFSNRVPFGTGPALQKIIDEPNGSMRVYSPDAFAALKTLFDNRHAFFNQERAWITAYFNTLHPSLQAFLTETNFVCDVEDCTKNCASLLTFEKRFFHHFNAFRIIKFLNFAHETFFCYTPIDECIHKSSSFLC